MSEAATAGQEGVIETSASTAQRISTTRERMATGLRNGTLRAEMVFSCAMRLPYEGDTEEILQRRQEELRHIGQAAVPGRPLMIVDKERWTGGICRQVKYTAPKGRDFGLTFSLDEVGHEAGGRMSLISLERLGRDVAVLCGHEEIVPEANAQLAACIAKPTDAEAQRTQWLLSSLPSVQLTAEMIAPDGVLAEVQAAMQPRLEAQFEEASQNYLAWADTPNLITLTNVIHALYALDWEKARSLMVATQADARKLTPGHDRNKLLECMAYYINETDESPEGA